MKQKRLSVIGLLLCVLMLFAATTSVLTGCNGNDSQNGTENPTTTAAGNTTTATGGGVVKTGRWSTATYTANTEVGEGTTTFSLIVQAEEQSVTLTVSTNKTVVGDALMELGIIEGNEGAYGLYVTAVNGMTLDWDTDHLYWALYIDGEYAMTGVDSVSVTAGAVYTLSAE